VIKKAFVIYYGYNLQIINGSVIDTFEYFYTAWEQDHNIKFILVGANTDSVKFVQDFICKRYNIDKNVLNNIISLKVRDFIVNKFTSIYCSDSNTMNMFNNNLPLQSEYKHIITEFNDDKFIFKNRKGVVYYSEMSDNRVQGDEYYYTKMRFDIIKKPRFHKPVLYVNAPKYGSNKFNDNIKFLKHIQSTLELHNLNKYISKGPGNTPNIFEEFSKYLYIKTRNWDDPRPRMFHECYYFDVQIDYYNIYNKDGSYYRYHELMQNGLENRFLTKDDTIVQRILNDM